MTTADDKSVTGVDASLLINKNGNPVKTNNDVHGTSSSTSNGDTKAASDSNVSRNEIKKIEDKNSTMTLVGKGNIHNENGRDTKSTKNGTTAKTSASPQMDHGPMKSNPPKRTDEEEKLRKRLHAKREEERLREILKRKKESFRHSKSSIDENESDKKVKLDEKDDGSKAQDEKNKTEKIDVVDHGTGKEQEKRGNTEKRSENRDKPRSWDESRDRRNHPPESDIVPSSRHHHRDSRHRHRHDRRPPLGPPTSFRGRDERPVPMNTIPPARSPYNHSYYDSRRPPPNHQRQHAPPPFFRDRGREGPSPRNGEDIDPFGRQRRFPDRDNRSYDNDEKSAFHRDQGGYRRQSRSPTDREGNRRERSRSRSRSVSSESSRSASSYSRSSYDDDNSKQGSRHKDSRSSRSSHSDVSSRGRSRSHSSSSSISVNESKAQEDNDTEVDPIPYSKDQRTVFVTQLVMRTTVKDLSQFFKHHGIKVNEIELLRDRRSGQHKGSAYVELKRMIDVTKALNLSGQAPTFQRFPILIKESEAERNLAQSSATTSVITPVVSTSPPTGISPALVATMQQQLQKQALKIKLPPLKDANGQLIQAQKVYVGNLEVNVVTAQHLQLLFAPFGTLTEVQLQNGKGFAFLQYYDPKEAALAIQTMAGQVLAGRPMKTGWATNPVISINGVAVVTSNEFPPDAAVRVQNAYQILAQITLATVVSPTSLTALNVGAGMNVPVVPSSLPMASAPVPTVADARASLAATAATMFVGPSSVPAIAASNGATDPLKIGNLENPSRHVLVHNMFNKDEETEPGWENDLREEFIEECGKYGTIVNVIVVSREVGGKVYTSFTDLAGAQTCARSLAGRWFDRRQLRTEYVTDEQVKLTEKEYPTTGAALLAT
jgi:RNA-binding protein 23/39